MLHSLNSKLLVGSMLISCLNVKYEMILTEHKWQLSGIIFKGRNAIASLYVYWVVPWVNCTFFCTLTIERGDHVSNIAYVILYQKEPAFQPTQHRGFEIVFVFISFQWTDRLCDHPSKDVAAGLTDVLLYLGNSSSFTGTFYVQTSSERWWMRLLNGFCDFYEHIRKLVYTPVILCAHRWVTTQHAVFVRHSLRVYI